MRATVNPVMFTKAEALRLEASHVNSLAQIIGFISYLRFGPAVSKRPQPPPPTESFASSPADRIPSGRLPRLYSAIRFFHLRKLVMDCARSALPHAANWREGSCHLPVLAPWLSFRRTCSRSGTSLRKAHRECMDRRAPRAIKYSNPPFACLHSQSASTTRRCV